MAEKDRIRYDKEKTAYQLKQKEDGAPQPDFYDEDADWFMRDNLNTAEPRKAGITDFFKMYNKGTL